MNSFLFFVLFFGGAGRVDVVHNQQAPVQQTLVFEEDLRIDTESGEDHVIWAGANVQLEADSKGNLYVVDQGNNRILKFDSSGQFVKQIGREGEGPGEFIALKSLSFLADGSAIVFENNQSFITFNWFDADMNFIRERVHSSVPFVLSPRFAPDGKTMAATFVDPQGSSDMQKIQSGVLGWDFKPLETVITFEQPKFDISRAQDQAMWIDLLAGWFSMITEDTGVQAIANDGTRYSALSTKYEIAVWDAEGNKQHVIRRDYKPKMMTQATIDGFVEPLQQQVLANMPDFLQQMVTKQLIEKAVAKADLAPAKPPIFALIPMEAGNFMVVHDHKPESNTSFGEIFNKRGQFVGTTTLPPIQINLFSGMLGDAARLTFKNGFAYATILDENDEFQAVRYRYSFKNN